jgi:hypothetical protein
MADIRRWIGDGSFDDFVRNDARCALGASGEE